MAEDAVQSLLASGTSDSVLAERGRYEIPFIERVVRDLAVRSALIAWQPHIPVGDNLTALGQ